MVRKGLLRVGCFKTFLCFITDYNTFLSFSSFTFREITIPIQYHYGRIAIKIRNSVYCFRKGVILPKLIIR